MTVCIASICENNKVFGACDRMMTSGDIEFEPDLDSLPKIELPGPVDLQYNTNTKIFGITSSIAIMTAGDSGLQSEIVQDVSRIVSKRISEQPQNWWTVKDVVDVYVQCYDKAKARRAHSSVYTPFGLDEKAFLEKSNQLSVELVLEITKQIHRFDTYFPESHGVETIITGIDGTPEVPQPHIYTVVKSCNDHYITCHDSIGFAAVGSGARHAESQFMLAGHSRHSSMSGTLLLTYLAKKRSEVAPGVGEGTDMFALGPNLGSFAMLDRIKDFDMKKIESIYEAVDKGQRKVFHTAKVKTHDYLDEVFKKRASQQQQNPPEKTGATPS